LKNNFEEGSIEKAVIKLFIDIIEYNPQLLNNLKFEFISESNEKITFTFEDKKLLANGKEVPVIARFSDRTVYNPNEIKKLTGIEKVPDDMQDWERTKVKLNHLINSKEFIEFATELVELMIDDSVFINSNLSKFSKMKFYSLKEIELNKTDEELEKEREKERIEKEQKEIQDAIDDKDLQKLNSLFTAKFSPVKEEAFSKIGVLLDESVLEEAFDNDVVAYEQSIKDELLILVNNRNDLVDLVLDLFKNNNASDSPIGLNYYINHLISTVQEVNTAPKREDVEIAATISELFLEEEEDSISKKLPEILIGKVVSKQSVISELKDKIVLLLEDENNEFLQSNYGVTGTRVKSYKDLFLESERIKRILENNKTQPVEGRISEKAIIEALLKGDLETLEQTNC
jgi:hypothetical protein